MFPSDEESLIFVCDKLLSVNIWTVNGADEDVPGKDMV